MYERRKMRALVYIATSIALAVTLFTSWQLREQAACQSEVNNQFLSSLKARAVIADQDRQSVRTLFTEAVKNGNNKNLSPEEKQKANKVVISEYFAAQNKLDQLRASNPLPDSAKCEDIQP